jgi:hypothetical protein
VVCSLTNSYPLWVGTPRIGEQNSEGGAVMTLKAKTIFDVFTESDSKKPYHIINGPGKYDLFIFALIQGENVTFTIKEIRELEPKIKGICHVHVGSATRLDQHPGEWLIEGEFAEAYYGELYLNGGLPFRALYSISSRQGWIEPGELEPIISREPFPHNPERLVAKFNPEIGRYQSYWLRTLRK